MPHRLSRARNKVCPECCPFSAGFIFCHRPLVASVVLGVVREKAAPGSPVPAGGQLAR